MTTLERSQIPVWLINLKRAEERRENMVKQLDVLGLPYQIFDAVDGRSEAERLAANVDQESFERNTGGALLPGKIGVYHSHLEVWDKLIASEAPAALILEDDVVFHDDFLEGFDTALSAAEHWDVIRFNAIRAKLPVCQGFAGRYRINAYIGPFTGNGAYLIKRETAMRLRPNLLPMTRPLDHELNRFFAHDYRQRGLEPWPSHVDDEGVSQITGRAFSDVKKFSLSRRLPYYRLKAANYFRRMSYLARRGALIPSSRQLDKA